MAERSTNAPLRRVGRVDRPHGVGLGQADGVMPPKVWPLDERIPFARDLQCFVQVSIVDSAWTDFRRVIGNVRRPCRARQAQSGTTGSRHLAWTAVVPQGRKQSCGSVRAGQSCGQCRPGDKLQSKARSVSRPKRVARQNSSRHAHSSMSRISSNRSETSSLWTNALILG